MPSLKHAALVLALVGCRKVATKQQCDAIVDRYVDLVVQIEVPDASAPEIAAAKKRVRDLAEADEDFRSCPAHVEVSQYECAMRAGSADVLERCLE